MSQQQLINLATEVADAREADLPHKLIKLRELAQFNDDPKKMKYDIYKFELLEALSVALTYEYGIIREGWQLAIDLVKTFTICTTDFDLTDKNYQGVFLPNATENILVLAKKIQDKHVKSKSYSEEFLKMFREIMSEYVKVVENNQVIAYKCLRSQRLFQLLLTDEQYTAAIMLNTYNSLFRVKTTLLRQLDEKSLNMLLDEIVYKMATSELAECGIAIFRLLNTMCQIDPNMIKLIVRRYKGIKMVINQWGERISSKELEKFFRMWQDADRTKYTDQEIHNKVVTIQRHWRGYAARKQLRQKNQVFARLQRMVRTKQETKQRREEKRLADNELKFQLMLQHRRQQRQRQCELLELIEILPANQLPLFVERRREEAAITIQALWRGVRARRLNAKRKQEYVEHQAARVIQFAVRQWLKHLKKRREEPAFYSRPRGLDGPRREYLFDHIRQHLDSQPPHPRTLKDAQELHDKSQRAFHDYVLGQRDMRKQQQNIQVLIAHCNNDADLLTNCPKLSQVSQDDVNSFYTHKQRLVVLEAKQVHKNTMRKHKSAWYRILNEESDSDDDLLMGIDQEDHESSDLADNIRNLNFDIDSDNYFRELRLGGRTIGRHRQPDELGITKKERKQLKTTYLKKAMTQMMKQRPHEARIWKDELFDDTNVQQTLALLESRAKDIPQ